MVVNYHLGKYLSINNIKELLSFFLEVFFISNYFKMTVSITSIINKIIKIYVIIFGIYFSNLSINGFKIYITIILAIYYMDRY